MSYKKLSVAHFDTVQRTGEETHIESSTVVSEFEIIESMHHARIISVSRQLSSTLFLVAENVYSLHCIEVMIFSDYNFIFNCKTFMLLWQASGKTPENNHIIIV